MSRWACKRFGKLTRGVFECQNGLVRGAAVQPQGLREPRFKGCWQVTRKAFECKDGLVTGVGSLPGELSRAKIQVGLVRGAGSLNMGS